LRPEASYETEGFFANVVFTCGAILQEDTLTIYYGAADRVVCAAELSLTELLDSLSVTMLA